MSDYITFFLQFFISKKYAYYSDGNDEEETHTWPIFPQSHFIPSLKHKISRNEI